MTSSFDLKLGESSGGRRSWYSVGGGVEADVGKNLTGSCSKIKTLQLENINISILTSE